MPAAGTVQLENEWIVYSAILADPPQLVVAGRGAGGTTAAVHDKGTTVYFVETRPIYAFAFVPAGCTYPDNALLQLRAVALHPTQVVLLQAAQARAVEARPHARAQEREDERLREEVVGTGLDAGHRDRDLVES